MLMMLFILKVVERRCNLLVQRDGERFFSVRDVVVHLYYSDWHVKSTSNSCPQLRLCLNLDGTGRFLWRPSLAEDIRFHFNDLSVRMTS